jgi:hypothetical protein
MLSMRGFIPVCIIIQPEETLISRRKIDGSDLLFLKWRKKWREEARDNQTLYKIAVKADNKFKCVLGGKL